jgi:hypothetical protein
MIEVHVAGRVKLGYILEFQESCKKWIEYRRSKGHSIPKVLFGLSGPMNSVRLILTYQSLFDFENEEKQNEIDERYVTFAMQMPFEGELTKELYSVY